QLGFGRAAIGVSVSGFQNHTAPAAAALTTSSRTKTLRPACPPRPPRRARRVPPTPSGVSMLMGGSALENQDARVQHVTLLECCAQCAMQAVLEVEIALPLDDVGEQVTEI